MKLAYTRCCTLISGLQLAVIVPVLAESNGATSELLSQHLYCSTTGFLEGSIGLLIGLVLMFVGLWAMIQGAKPMAVLPVILIGSLITALPSLIESSFSGLSSLLSEEKITAGTFNPPDCANLPAAKNPEKTPDTGNYVISPGKLLEAAECKPGDMRIDCR